MTTPSGYDVVFIVALNEEAKVLQRTFGAELKSEISIGIFSFSDLQIENDEYWANKKVGLLCLGDQGPERAVSGTGALLQHISTRLLVSIGISGRLSNECSLGDVVFAQSCLDYSFRVRASRERFEAAGDVKETTNIADVMGRINQHDYLQGLEHRIDPGIKNKLKKASLLNDYPRIYYGDIASGPYLVDNSDFRSFIKQQNRLLLAVDMESHGILESAASAKYRGATMVVRGISDLADGTKSTLDGKTKGKIRNQAMRAAVAAFKFVYEDCIEFSAHGELNARKSFQFNRPIVDRLILLTDKIQKNLNGKLPDPGVSDVVSSLDEKHPLVSPLQLGEFSFRLFFNITDQIPKRLANYLRSAPDEVMEFTTAYFVVQSVKWSDSPNRTKAILALQAVYPASINRYCKAIMNIELQKNRNAYFQKLIRAYSMGHREVDGAGGKVAQRRAQVAYLMGRISVKPFANEAATWLIKWRDELLEKTLGHAAPRGPVLHGKAGQREDRQRYNLQIAAAAAESNEFRLLLRTIQISLIQLGNMAVSDDFILECMANEKYDGQNRGFHLEYYGDIPYNPHEKLSNYDDGKSDFPKTFSRLCDSLSSAGNQSSMHDVQLYTLISLAHIRLMLGTLDDKKKTEIRKILGSSSWKSDNPELEGYRLLIKEQFESDSIRPTFIIEKLFSLKKSHRRGWNDSEYGRCVPNPETIASHTFGTMVLAYMLLPETDAAAQFNLPADYSKETIIKYLLVHDLAEAWIGDLLPRERTEATMLDEIEAFRKLAANYSYGEFNGKDAFRDWNYFQNGTSINSVLARDFDILDNLVQLNIESQDQDNKIPDRDAWIKYIEKRISPDGLPYLRFLSLRQLRET